MSEVYDRERTAALIDEARELTAALKIETKEIETVIEKVFDAGDTEESEVDGTKEAPAPRFKWWFWR